MQPYRTLNEHLQSRYGGKTYKLTVSGGVTCPTRDGTFGPKKGWGGCTFCDAFGSASYFARVRKELPVQEQLELAAEGIRRRFKAEKFIAYFQSYTTSHKEVEDFKKRYHEALSFPDLVAVDVATRPDCLPDEFLNLLPPLLKEKDVILELGVQSFNDETLEWYDRGHNRACAIDALKRSLALAKKLNKDSEQNPKGNKLDVIAHLIFGAPNETIQDLEDTAKILNEIGVQGVKIHNLHVLKRTKLAAMFKKNTFPIPTLEEYVAVVSHFLRHLDPEIIVHRIHGTPPKRDELIAPEWSKLRAYPAQQLQVFMKQHDFRQGDRLERRKWEGSKLLKHGLLVRNISQNADGKHTSH